MPEPRQEPCHYHEQKFDRPLEPRSRTLQLRSTYIMAEFIFGTGISIVQARTESVWISDQHLQNTRCRVRTFARATNTGCVRRGVRTLLALQSQ